MSKPIRTIPSRLQLRLSTNLCCRHKQTNNKPLGIPVVRDLSAKLINDNTANETSAKSVAARYFSQLRAAAFLPYKIEIGVRQRHLNLHGARWCGKRAIFNCVRCKLVQH